MTHTHTHTHTLRFAMNSQFSSTRTARIIHGAHSLFVFFSPHPVVSQSQIALNNIAIEAASVTVRRECMHVCMQRRKSNDKRSGSQCQLSQLLPSFLSLSGWVRVFFISLASAPQRFSFPETQATFHQVVNPPGRLPPIKSQHPQFGPAQ